MTLGVEAARARAPRALRLLVEHAVDYAGLFPPAALDMRAAAASYARSLAGADRWLLGRFVVPAARLGELESAVDDAVHASRAVAEPWRVSVLAGAGDASLIEGFNARNQGRLTIDAAELRANGASEILALAGTLPAGVDGFVELPLGGNLPALVDATRQAGLRAKVRTGAVTADGFPHPGRLAGFVELCAEADLPFKATAGLHHLVRNEYALTYEPDAARATMFGFLNLFAAAALARGGTRGAPLEQVLEERDASAFVFDDMGFGWRGHRVTAADVALTRRHALVSFGSCSFDEPAEELARFVG